MSDQVKYLIRSFAVLMLPCMLLLTGCSGKESGTVSGKSGGNGIDIPSELREDAAYPEVETSEKSVEDTSDLSDNEATEQTIYDSSMNDYNEVELTDEELSNQFYEQHYGELSFEEIESLLVERNVYYNASGYYEEIIDYWENVRDVRDVANRIEPLFFTDMRYYAAEDFQGTPAVVIHLAKNEIYARHGYIFKNEDLNNYFMGCIWYQPVCNSEEFDDSVFNDYEKENLKILSDLDAENA